MTPNETHPAPVDEDLLARVIACDAVLHAVSIGDVPDSSAPVSTVADDERGRGRLMLLLAMLEAADPSPNRRGDSDEAPTQSVGQADKPLLGRFDILEELGSGGFGFVVRARDRLLGREVALKMPLPERALSSGELHRFLHEARAAAMLDHPNIVRVFEAGQLGPLGYFIASEYCQGPTLKSWLKAQTEAVPARLAARWARALAGAVEQAHERGILHRDIKPSNVILSGGPAPYDLIPRLTDFGLAKVIADGRDESRSDARMGTPDYMSPEQAAGRRKELGPAADIYSLGVTLYESLAGRTPFRGENEAETLRLAANAEPISLRSLRPGLPRDLETICLKCLRKEPSARYRSAGELRDDLERFLDGRPIHCRPVSRTERVWVWARRRPAVASLVGLVAVLTCGLLGGVAAWVRSLERHNRQLQFQIARADQQTREAAKQGRIAQERQHQADRHRYAASLRRAREALDAQQIELAQDILHEIEPGLPRDHSAGFAWGFLWRSANREFTQLWGHDSTVLGSLVSADGTTLATDDLSGKILFWTLSPDMALDRPRATVARSKNREDYVRLILSHDGRYLAIEPLGAAFAAVVIHETSTGRLLCRLSGEESERGGVCAFSADSKRLALVVDRPGGKKALRWWDIRDRNRDLHSWTIDDGVGNVEISAAGNYLAAFMKKSARLHDLWTGELKVTLAHSELGEAGLACRPSVSEDGRVIAAQKSLDGFRWWDASSGGERPRFDLARPVFMELSAKGTFLAVMNDQGEVAVLEAHGKRQWTIGQGKRSHNVPFSLSFSSDENRLAVVLGMTGHPPPEVWDLASARRIAVFPGRRDVDHVAFVPRANAVIATGASSPRIWRLDPPRAPDAVAGHAVEAWCAAFSLDGENLATGSDDTGERQTIKLWDRASGRLLAGWQGHTATVASLAFSPDGRILASASLDWGKPAHPNVLLWDVASRTRLANLTGHDGSVRSIAFSPDGMLLATAGDDMIIRLWDTKLRKCRATLRGHTQPVNSVAFSPDGQTLASGSCDFTVRIWKAPSFELSATLNHSGNVNAVAFSPSDPLLAAADQTGQITLWNLETGKSKLSIHSADDQLRCAAFTPDGRYIAASGKDKVIRLWDVATGQGVLNLNGHKAQINALSFSPEGAILASCSHDGAVKLWRAEPIEVVSRR